MSDNATDTRATILVPILMRQREGKPGGGKGPLISENMSLTIATSNDQILFQETADRSGQAWSIREDAKANTFSATPLQVTNALQAHQPSVQSHHAQTFITQEIEVKAIPLDMRNAGRDPEKHDEMNRQGVGVGNEGDPAHTVTSAFVNGVAHEITTVLGDVTHSLTAEGHDASEDGTGRGTPIIGFQPTDGGFANFNDDGNSVTIKASDAPAAAYDEFNDSLGDTHHTLRAGTKQSTGVVTTIVRRLTPTECERLQGFPDGWTAQRIDHKTGQLVEQKDSARYKQMGNAVAVPCVQWILARIMEGTQ